MSDRGVEIAGRIMGLVRSERGQNLFSNLPRGTRQAIKYGVAAVVIPASFYYVGEKIAEGGSEIGSIRLQVDYSLLLVSFILTMVCTVLGGVEWNLLLRGLGVRLPLRKALRIHLLSILPKYIPGYGWQLLGKIYLCRGAGVPASSTALSMLAEMAIVFLAGVSIAAIVLPYSVLPKDNQIIAAFQGLPLPSLVFAYVLAVPLVLKKSLQSRLVGPFRRDAAALSYWPLFFTFVAVAATWYLLGISFFLLARAFYPVSPSQIPSFILASTTSFLVSLLAFFVPVGIGVREGAITFLLSLWMPAPFPAIIAIMSRLVMALGESLAFLIACKL